MRASEFIVESVDANSWIDKVYSMYPQQWQNNHVMPMGDEQFAMFELVPSMSKRGAVEVKWFQAYPLRQGVGSRAMQELQKLAKEDGIHLTLFPWEHGQVSQSKLTKFYKGQGFKPTMKGSKSMAWDPTLDEEVLDETAEENQILNKLSHVVTNKVIDIFRDEESSVLNLKVAFDPSFLSRKDKLIWLNGLYLSQLYVPKTSSPIINKMIEVTQIRLAKEYNDNDKRTLGSYSEYTDRSKIITIYIPAIIDRVEAKQTFRSVAEEMQNTLIHEMQHCIDDLKSEGKYASKRLANTELSSQDDYMNYLKLPYEINARFTEALLDIATAYKTIEGPHRLQDLIKKSFDDSRLAVAVNPRQYKRLVTRTYKFFDALQNKPINIVPKSLAQRALAWITSSPTTEIK